METLRRLPDPSNCNREEITTLETILSRGIVLFFWIILPPCLTAATVTVFGLSVWSAVTATLFVFFQCVALFTSLYVLLLRVSETEPGNFIVTLPFGLGTVRLEKVFNVERFMHLFCGAVCLFLLLFFYVLVSRSLFLFGDLLAKSVEYIIIETLLN